MLTDYVNMEQMKNANKIIDYHLSSGIDIIQQIADALENVYN